MTTDIRAALDAAEQFATGEAWAGHPLAIILEALIKQTRTALAAEPVGEGPSDEEITLQAGKFLAYSDAHMGDPARWEGSDADLLAFARAVLPQPARPAAPPTPEPPAEALAARPLLEQVARLGDCIGANTVGQIAAISSRAAAWLEENPPGQPVAIEPRGCPTPGACSCVETAPAAPEAGEVGELVDRLGWIAAQLGDIGWSDDSASVARAAALLSQPPAPAPAVVPVAVEALTRLYWWGGMSGSYGYSADVVLGVRDWIDGGMVGSLPPLPAWVADRCPPLLQGGEGEA
jgi:hypothetical protein